VFTEYRVNSRVSANRRLRQRVANLLGLRGAVEEFDAQGNGQEWSIRYVSGPRNQKIFPFQQFPRTPQPSELTIFELLNSVPVGHKVTIRMNLPATRPPAGRRQQAKTTPGDLDIWFAENSLRVQIQEESAGPGDKRPSEKRASTQIRW
jgi:hypothetical protein